MEFITSNTNKKIVITPATFQEASELKKETMKCISQANLLKDLDFTNFASLDANKIFKAVAELITNIDSSPDFENAVFKCLGRCTCDGISVTKQLFDDKPELREDYYEIIFECCKVNLTPFMKSLSSALLKALETPISLDQEQK